MNNKLVFADYLIFIVYFFIVAGYGYWIYQRKRKAVTDTHDFFLAEGSLTWWAIGASLIASNLMRSMMHQSPTMLRNPLPGKSHVYLLLLFFYADISSNHTRLQ